MVGSTFTLDEIANLFGGELDGDPAPHISGVAPITEARPGDISFIHTEKYLGYANSCQATALVVRTDLSLEFRPLIRTPNPYYMFARIMELFHHTTGLPPVGQHFTALISPSAHLGKEVCLGALSTIGDHTVIDDNAIICPSVRIGSHCRIGPRSCIYPHVVIGDHVTIGADCIIASGCHLGAFDTNFSDLPTVVLGDHVEMGANGLLQSGEHANQPTTIGTGSKIDNLLTMHAGASMGENCLIVAQVIIGADTHIGNHVTIAGQVSIQPQLSVGNHVMIAATSQVCESIPDNQVYSGWPARPHDFTQRLKPALIRIPKLTERIAKLE